MLTKLTGDKYCAYWGHATPCLQHHSFQQHSLQCQSWQDDALQHHAVQHPALKGKRRTMICQSSFTLYTAKSPTMPCYRHGLVPGMAAPCLALYTCNYICSCKMDTENTG